MKRMRSKLHQKKLAESHYNAVVACTAINNSLFCNKAVEQAVISNMANDNQCLTNATVEDFLWLTSSQLQDFIHARLFDGKTFQTAQIVGTDGKLNKTRYRCQTAEDIEQDCSKSEPCLVWLLGCSPVASS